MRGPSKSKHKKEIKFMGHLVTNEAVHVDKSKLEAILSMPAPIDVHGVTRLCEESGWLSGY